MACRSISRQFVSHLVGTTDVLSAPSTTCLSTQSFVDAQPTRGTSCRCLFIPFDVSLSPSMPVKQLSVPLRKLRLILIEPHNSCGDSRRPVYVSSSSSILDAKVNGSSIHSTSGVCPQRLVNGLHRPSSKTSKLVPPSIHLAPQGCPSQ